MNGANHRVRSAAPSVLKSAASSLACAGLLMLAGCASAPTDHFYTLGGDAAPAQATQTGRHAAAFFIEVPPVGVPQQVSRSQLVINTGPGQVDIKEQERWSAPLSDEISRALSADLTRQLGTIDVYRTPRPAKLPVYRVTVNVQRFESSLGAHARIDAVWSVRQVPGDAVLTCRSTVSETVGAGYDALVNGHRRAVRHIADDIATAVDAFAAAPMQPGVHGAPATTTVTPQAACPAGS
jgi:uncharacterized lipoprotein YmbA